MEQLKIIIADDNKDIAELEKNYIENTSEFKILGIALSSKEELELIDKYSPDLIITDIVRKGEDVSGLDIILKCEKENRSINFILITASEKKDIIWKNDYKMPSNIISYLKKPIEWKSLITEIEKANILHFRKKNQDKKYYSEKILNLFEELSNDQIMLLYKLDILVEDKLYSNYEYDMLKLNVSMRCSENKEIEKNKKMISVNEYKDLMNAFDRIDEKYIYNK